MAAIKTNGGWFLELSTLDNKPKLDTPIYEKTDEQKARESWVCSICGENTFEVDYDYIGSGYNHLGCELKSQEEIDEYIEDIDEQAYAQGRGSSYYVDDNGHYHTAPTSEDDERNKLSEEIVDDTNKGYIYESPDGGKTIYKREFGSDDRIEIKVKEIEK